jgi:hypothetical protein
MVTASAKDISWEGVWKTVDAVRDRLLRATRLLDDAGIAYAVIGGNAVASWVFAADPSAVRYTADVDLLINRSDLERVRQALEPGGFRYRHSAGIDMFLDGTTAKARDAIHVIFANEKVRAEYALPTPNLTESERSPEYQVLSLEALVRMKLTSFRKKDQVHILDMIRIDMIDESWLQRFPPILAERLCELLSNPDA